MGKILWAVLSGKEDPPATPRALLASLQTGRGQETTLKARQPLSQKLLRSLEQTLCMAPMEGNVHPSKRPGDFYPDNASETLRADRQADCKGPSTQSMQLKMQ